MEAEIWKDVVGFEGYYQVSNFGSVRGVDRYTRNRRCEKYLRKGRDIVAYPNKMGYMVFTSSMNHTQKMLSVHRLVATAFIPNPENKPCVNHINGIKSDNRVVNLEWCTYTENALHAYETGLRHSSMTGKSGSKSAVSKQIVQLTQADEFVSVYWGRFEAERMTGIKEANIKYAISSNAHATGGFKWMRKSEYDELCNH